MSRLALRMDDDVQDIDTIRQNYARLREKFAPPQARIVINPSSPPLLALEAPKQSIVVKDLTNDWVQRELEKWNIQKSEKVTFKTIMREVAIKHRIPVESFKIEKRSRPLVDARQECFYRLRYELNMTMHQIGTAMNRDHSTVMHGIQQFALKNKETINGTVRTEENLYGIIDTKAEGVGASSDVG